MTFRVGQKVVCVDDSPSKLADCEMDGRIVRGRIYTVRSIDRFLRNGMQCIRLVGVASRARRGGPGDGEELAWKGSRFRPLIERKTDISIFTEMLNPSEIERVKKELV